MTQVLEPSIESLLERLVSRGILEKAENGPIHLYRYPLGKGRKWFTEQQIQRAIEVANECESLTGVRSLEFP